MNAKELLKGFDITVGNRGVLEIANAGRGELADFLAKFAKKGAEVGVAYGKYSERLMQANPTLELYGIDAYTTYSGYKDYALKSTMNVLKEDAHRRLDKYPTYQFIEKFSMDAVPEFEDNSLDFVYIDANHNYDHVLQDVTEWTKKVRPGGVVSGHDYAKIANIESRYEVIEAVNRYCRDNKLDLYIWGLESKADRSLIRDTIRSWMFFKP